MKRTVFLVDMNAFFISCEMTRNPALRGRPAAVAGDPKKRSGIILAANYDARAFSVRTTMTIGEARRLCPALQLVPCDHAFYSARSKEVMNLLYTFSPVLEQNSIDEAWLDMTGSEGLYGKPAVAAKTIMEKIKNELGLWCSIGIAENKFLAKMVSEFKKPLGISELWPENIPSKLWPLPVEAMYGVGRQTAGRLRNIGLFTIGDIAACDETALARRFGKYGKMLFSLARGIDNAPVTPHQKDEMKSIGRSTTLPEDVTDLEHAKKIIMELAEEIGADARRSGKKGTTVQITIKYADFTNITRQKSIPPTCLTGEIIRAGTELLEKNWNAGRPVRLLGIGISGFAQMENAQLSLFDCAGEERPSREEQLENAVDSLRSRFGRGTIRRASLIEKGRDGSK